MGPTNVALVKLFQADQALREAQERLDAATKNVRIQDRKTKDLEQKLTAAQQRARELQAKSNNADLDLKSRDGHIERLRSQQQSAKNNKEYQAFLIEINTMKVDRAKVEEVALAGLSELEAAQKEAAELVTMVQSHREKSASMKTEMTDTVAKLQAEIDSLKGPRDAAAAALPPKARGVFDRLAEHHEGEALSAIFKPDRRKEEYACSSCMMDLVTDVYNRLHTRDEITFCPSCRRVLYIPDDLPPEMAVNKKKAGSTSSGVTSPDAAAAPHKPTRSISKAAARAKGSLGTLLAAAQGESVKNAVDAKQDAAEFNVTVDGKLAGVYKAKNQENLERIIRFRLEEANLSHQIAVEPVPAAAPAAPPAAAPATSNASDAAAESPVPASHDPGMPETQSSEVTTPAEPPVVNA